ncbi:MAG: dihydrodipicolinate synthase family protein, partial [Anaerovoracaceae bacterium]
VAPKETHDICQLYLDGRVKESRDLQLRALPLIEALFSEVNPIPVKKAVELLGLCGGTVREPLTELEPAHTEQLRTEMMRFGLL